MLYAYLTPLHFHAKFSHTHWFLLTPSFSTFNQPFSLLPLPKYTHTLRHLTFVFPHTLPTFPPHFPNPSKLPSRTFPPVYYCHALLIIHARCHFWEIARKGRYINLRNEMLDRGSCCFLGSITSLLLL